ncbi:MAG: hydrogenase expression/formation protein HypE [Deltaproteobacteria bacterium]|nr:hydrogenase expression/formation protein HypE [Deltaproteobacteria bacterium]
MTTGAYDNIILSHGSGGALTRSLIEDVFLKAFDNPLLRPLNDQAVLHIEPDAKTGARQRLAFTTDSYVISPIFFPGADIGKLAVCGTINDLAVGGAEALYLSASFIMEEGLPMADLKRVVRSMADTALAAGVRIVTGDTKVVERGKADRLFINTAGIGVLNGHALIPENISPGDAIIVSGTIGDHGVAVMTHRHGIAMDTPVISDCAALNGLVNDMLATGANVKAMRDATRGGVATALNEFAASAGCAMLICEDDIPVKNEVRGACELLGFEPLYLANEGKLVAVVENGHAKTLLESMRTHPLGKDAAIIGFVSTAPKGKVLLETTIGNKRILDMPAGELLPRIC